jgi:GalNAc-alpha-(1->4)-GalNAc-alpha-(1->3)-diNAcBac-PP-undecaprenol alpha-1,4-N-acetyl-D-galactosaminyltransferase
MKIQFLVADLNLFGGGERVALNLADGFSKYFSYETEVVSIQKISEPLPFALPNNVSARSVGLDLHSANWAGKIYSRIRAFLCVPDEVASDKANIVFGIGTFPNLILSVLGKSSVKRVGCEHSWHGAPSFYWKVLRQILYPRLDALVTLTEAAKKDARGLNSKIHVIPNSSPFDNPPKANLYSNRILAIGRLDDGKGFDDLIKAFSIIAKKCPDWSVEIFGEGPSEPSLKKQVKALDLSNQIKINHPTREIEKEYQNASFLALTSKHEGLPMVLIEALCFGLPAVAFDCSHGPREIIKDGETGFLVQLGNINQLVDRMSDLIFNAERREQMSENSLRHAKKFSQRSICQQWKDFIEDFFDQD